MIVNTALKEVRKGAGLTQAQVAEKACIAERTYQEYEYGKRKPGVEVAIRIAEALGVVEFEKFKSLFGAGTPNKFSTN